MTNPEPSGPPSLQSLEQVPPAAREYHRWFGETDWSFRRAAFRSPELREPARFETIHPYSLGPQFGFDNHSWPLFIDKSRWRSLEADVVGIVRLLLDTPRRVVGDASRVAELYGIYPPPVYDIMLAPPNAVDTAVARGDFLVQDGQVRILELNASPNSGGWEMAELTERYRRHPLIHDFLDHTEVDVVEHDSLAALFRHLLSAGRGHLTDGAAEVAGRFDTVMVHGGRSPFDIDSPFGDHVRRTYRRVVEEVGFEGEVTAAALTDLTVEGGEVHLAGRRVHALLEDDVEVPPALYRVFKAGRVALFNGPLEPVLSDKRNLALLSEHTEMDPAAWTEEELDLVRRVLPWTRITGPRRVRYRGTEADLADLAMAEQNRWVLKPARESGGRGVTFGNQVDAASWREVVDQAVAAGDWVLQERGEIPPFVSLRRTPDGGGELALHDTVFGLMVFGDRLAGGMVRYQPREIGGAVNAARSATPGNWLLVG